MRRLEGLFINCLKAQDSIYESGKMVFQCLSGSDSFSLDYIEVEKDQRTVPGRYDFYFFNYHISTMAWLDTKAIKSLLPGITMTIVLEVSPNDPFVCCSPDDFEVYCVLDPTMDVDLQNVFAFPRPLEEYDVTFGIEESDVPVIGSFGFATQGKGFEQLVEAVNKEFDRAVVRLNIPPSTYADKDGIFSRQLAENCRAIARPGIELLVTHDYMTKPELIEWCRQNTINCFLYDRNMPGLAATTDQAISSGKPLLVSNNETFRHIHRYLRPYPEQSLKDAITYSRPYVDKMKEDWSPLNFRKCFEKVLNGLEFSETKTDTDTVELKVVRPDSVSYIQRLRNKVAIRSTIRSLVKSFVNKAPE